MEHFISVHLIRQTSRLGSLIKVGINFSKDILVSICSPESFDKLIQSDESFSLFINFLQEFFYLIIWNPNLEPYNSIPQLINRNSLTVVFIYQVKTLVNSQIILSQILSNLLKDSPFPLNSIKLLYT